MPLGDGATGHRDDNRFRPAVKNPARVIGIPASFQGKNPFQSASYIGRYRVCDGGDANSIRFGRLLMGQPFPVTLVKVKQYLTPRPYRSGCVFFPQSGFDRFDIVVRKLDMVLLGSRHFLSLPFLLFYRETGGKENIAKYQYVNTLGFIFRHCGHCFMPVIFYIVFF